VEDSDPTEEKLRKLRNALSIGQVPVDIALAILASLLNFPTAEPVSLTEISAERQRNIAEQVFIDWIRHLARTSEILVTFEDEQWADTTSRDVLSKIIDILPSIPALILLSTRTDPEASWTKVDNVLHVKLNALGRVDTEEMVRDISPTAPP